MSHDRPLTPAQNPATVRLAMPVEALQIAEIQRRAWAKDPVQAVFLKQVGLDEMAETWHRAITRPPLAQYRVLVATEPTGRPEATEVHDQTRLAQRVVGFAAIGPSDDPDAGALDSEVGEFIIDDLGRDLGHDGRLLNAIVDTMRADGFQRATWWVRTTDDVLRRLLVESGWDTDGAHRELGTDEDEEVVLRQVRLHTDISPQ